MTGLAACGRGLSRRGAGCPPATRPPLASTPTARLHPHPAFARVICSCSGHTRAGAWNPSKPVKAGVGADPDARKARGAKAGDIEGPPAHPKELTYPCCLPTLGGLGEISPHEGPSSSVGHPAKGVERPSAQPIPPVLREGGADVFGQVCPERFGHASATGIAAGLPPRNGRPAPVAFSGVESGERDRPARDHRLPAQMPGHSDGISGAGCHAVPITETSMSSGRRWSMRHRLTCWGRSNSSRTITSGWNWPSSANSASRRSGRPRAGMSAGRLPWWMPWHASCTITWRAGPHAWRSWWWKAPRLRSIARPGTCSRGRSRNSRGCSPGRVRASWPLGHDLGYAGRRRIRLEAYGARLESGLGSRPHEFKSRILRHTGRPRRIDPAGAFLRAGALVVTPAPSPSAALARAHATRTPPHPLR